MGKTITVLKHEFRQTIKRNAFIIMTVSLPLLLMLGYGIYQGVEHWYKPSEPDELKIGYVDEVGKFGEYTSQGDVTLIQYPNEDEAKAALLKDEIQEYIVIPTDYLFSGSITRYILKSEMEVPGKVWVSIEDFLLSNLLAGEISPELLQRAKLPMGLNTLQLDESGEIAVTQDEISKYVLPIVFGILFVFAIFFSSGFLLQSVSEEKENRVIEIVLSSLSARQLLAGKILGLGAAGLFQVAVWFIAVKVFADAASVNIPALSELSVTTSFLLFGMVYFLLGYLLFAAIYASVGSIGSTARESQGMSGILVMPAFLPLWLNYFITSNPESIFAKVLTFFPLTAPVTAMMRLSRDSISPWEIGLSLVILAGSVVLATWAAAKIFRVFLLMYGKRPALREIVRYVREG
ncbi:MAG: ABC transporter permease [Dehalococcoidia bacterium]|nr:ABC transporter permease [Dehalococcoidia bacterium]